MSNVDLVITSGEDSLAIEAYSEEVTFVVSNKKTGICASFDIDKKDWQKIKQWIDSSFEDVHDFGVDMAPLKD